MEEGKIILASNLIFSLNKDASKYYSDFNFSDKHTDHPLAKI